MLNKSYIMPYRQSSIYFAVCNRYRIFIRVSPNFAMRTGRFHNVFT